MDNIFERTIQLIGSENFNKLKNAKIAVFGIGGVGGTTLESLIRSGASNITIIDFDKVSFSNINRQLLFTYEDVGKTKVDCAIEKFKKINSELKLNPINEKVDSSFFEKNNLKDFDYFVDAIDDTKGKLEIAKYAFLNNIPLIVCLGMGNRLDPSKVFLTTLNKTENDPLARKIRQLYRKNNLDLDKIFVVVSSETPIKSNEGISSMMMVPSSAGLLITYKIIKDIVE